mmetsp:Transcript_9041/g.22100  ORF Transcript_9041/g.22100 Transcript_9041/m.22100 type:complete len:90 (+) Transcript_9041:313-582(+)
MIIMITMMIMMGSSAADGGGVRSLELKDLAGFAVAWKSELVGGLSLDGEVVGHNFAGLSTYPDDLGGGEQNLRRANSQVDRKGSNGAAV